MDMTFRVIEDGKEIVCDILLTFKDENNDINYIVYTDGTKDNDGELEIYASRYVEKDNSFYLEEIKNESEWDLIDSTLESKYREID